MPDPEHPPTIPDHRLIRVIRRGSYGEVWLAENELGQARAVKVVHRAFFDDARPYEREWEGIVQYEPISRQHEHLVPVLHVGRSDDEGYFYYVMELADNAAPDGERYQPHSLKQVIERQAPMKTEEVLQIALPLVEALAFIHKNGLVHRDIKPSNILYRNGVPCLADPGLITSSDATMSLVGTLGYMPPEGPGRPSGDIFSMGIVFYELMTGNDRQSFPALPESLKINKSTPFEYGLNQFILKSCEAKPAKRYSDIQTCLEDLKQIITGAEPPHTRMAVQTKLAVVGSAVLVAALVWVWLGFVKQRPEESELWDFEYAYTHVHATNALQHVVERKNVQQFTEWQRPPVTYWAPISNSIPAILTYRFDFPRPTRELFIRAQSEAWNFEVESGAKNQAKGAYSLSCSTDGVNWIDLINRLEPTPQWGGLSEKDHSLNFVGSLSSSLTGKDQLWIRVTMLCSGVQNDAGFFPVQHSRAEYKLPAIGDNKEFEVRARFE